MDVLPSAGSPRQPVWNARVDVTSVGEEEMWNAGRLCTRSSLLLLKAIFYDTALKWCSPPFFILSFLQSWLNAEDSSPIVLYAPAAETELGYYSLHARCVTGTNHYLYPMRLNILCFFWTLYITAQTDLCPIKEHL